MTPLNSEYYIRRAGIAFNVVSIESTFLKGNYFSFESEESFYASKFFGNVVCILGMHAKKFTK